MKNLVLIFSIFLSNFLYSQTFTATVNRGDHLVKTTDWSRYNSDNILVESADKNIRKFYSTESARNYNQDALYIKEISQDFPQNSQVIVTVCRPRHYWGYSDPILAIVKGGSYLMKPYNWSLVSNRDILVEELNGENQNLFTTIQSRSINPNAMLVDGINDKYDQNTWVYVYSKNANIDQKGNMMLTNTQNTNNAGGSITFSDYGQSNIGSKIRGALELADGNNSRVSLILSSYYGDFKEELTLKNGKVGINTLNPSSYLDLFIPASSSKIDGLSIDVQSFGNTNNKNESTFFQLRDLGALQDPVFIIKGSGNVGIGTNSPQNKLDVNGTIHAKEVKRDMNGWADYVFKKDYALPTLSQVEDHIKEKGHLPNIPTEKEVLENGLSLGESQKVLLQKIEELTLYIIQQNKELINQKEINNSLEHRIINLENKNN